MEIFISWSGARSKACAELLRDWLPKVINAVKPWISSADIDKGARWGQEVSSRLSSAQFGIICLTPLNLNNDWILFEAGALSKSIEGSRTCTLLLDLAPSDVSFPLAQFQATKVDKADIYELLRTINRAAGDKGLNDQLLLEVFEVWWPKLQQQLNALPSEGLPKAKKRSDRDLLEEVVEILRDQERRRDETTTIQQSKSSALTDTERATLIFDKAREIGTSLGLAIGGMSSRLLSGFDECTLNASTGAKLTVRIPESATSAEIHSLLERAIVNHLEYTKTRVAHT